MRLWIENSTVRAGANREILSQLLRDHLMSVRSQKIFRAQFEDISCGSSSVVGVHRPFPFDPAEMRDARTFLPMKRKIGKDYREIT